MFTAVLDANVLVPTALCDTLLRLAEAGFYRPLWSDRILVEVEDAVLRLYPDLGVERIRRRTRLMSETFEDATVTGWEQVSAGLDLPDHDDRHVLAAAIVGGAQAVVTANLKDFPDSQLGPRGIEARHPTTSFWTSSTSSPVGSWRCSCSRQPTSHGPRQISPGYSHAWLGVVCPTSSRPFVDWLQRTSSGRWSCRMLRSFQSVTEGSSDERQQ